ncbi:MAG TPA: amino acid permease [Gemmataceae bacterium]|nr:amino acid permease [Gemmataceae bacterium]
MSISRPAQVIIVSSVMLTFISYWRTAAVVLCDLASTAYYIGGIVEQSVGKAAPWFILAVMCFSYAVRWVYIESCTLFVRGGVYRVVREALGRRAAKVAVSALMFDYVLTGPISGVSAGQYVVGLVIAAIEYAVGHPLPSATVPVWKAWGPVLIACAVTLYFYRQNVLGIHESSDKALKIMAVTTVMGVVVLLWSGVTVISRAAHPTPEAPAPQLPTPAPRLTPRENPDNGETVDPLGFVRTTGAAEEIRTVGTSDGPPWLSLVGFLGVAVAFGHSILAMSGEETLAQVYREVESPKLKNFKRAAFIVFVYSLLLTGLISFLAVVIIPDEERMSKYADNLIGGLAMHVAGPVPLRLLLNAFVVIVGFLILSGAVNTAIVGSNGVLNRVAEDGVLPDWFLKPHPRYGTTYRLLSLITGLQLFTIVASRGNVLLLGEAYAFGVVWSFVFQALSMVVLRFKDRRPRPFKVPLNVQVRGVEIPVGLLLILALLLIAAVANLLTKEVATVGGVVFTAAFFAVFYFSERYSRREAPGPAEHLEQFNQQSTEEVTSESLGLTRRYRKLVAIRSPHNLFMLDRALAESDPETTGIVVMTAKLLPPGAAQPEQLQLDVYERELLTEVVRKAEQTGKEVKALVVPTNNPLHAVLRIARDIQAHEVIVGPSNRYTADEQISQIAFYWISLHHGEPAPLTVHIAGRERDLALDLGGGNRVPKISERRARSVGELRAAGVGVGRVLMLHDGTPAAGDLFRTVLTALDPQVVLALVPGGGEGFDEAQLYQDREQARHLRREVPLHEVKGDVAEAVVRLAREGGYDLVIVPLPAELPARPNEPLDRRSAYILQHAPCPVFLGGLPLVPHEVVDTQAHEPGE